MRVAERELEALALRFRTVADSLDLQSLLEAVGDPLDHVRDQAPGEPVQGAMRAAVGRPLDREHALVELDRDVLVDRLHQLALGPLDSDLGRGDLDGHPVGDLEWLVTDAAHPNSARGYQT